MELEKGTIKGLDLGAALRDIDLPVLDLTAGFGFELNEALRNLIKPGDLLRLRISFLPKGRKLVDGLKARGYSESEALMMVARMDDPKIRKRVHQALR